jgi:hypothetical protein
MEAIALACGTGKAVFLSGRYTSRDMAAMLSRKA